MEQATREQTVPNSSSNLASKVEQRHDFSGDSNTFGVCGGLTVLVPGDHYSIPSKNQLVGMTWVPLSRAHFQRVSVFVHKCVNCPYVYRFVTY